MHDGLQNLTVSGVQIYYRSVALGHIAQKLPWSLGVSA